MNRRLAMLVAVGIIVMAALLGLYYCGPWRESEATRRRLDDAARFLLDRFNPELQLVSEAPEAAPDVYWLASDNLLAQHVLRKYFPDISEKIRSKLVELAGIYGLPTNSEGLPISHKHEAVLGYEVPLPFNITNFYEWTIGDSYTIKTEVLNNTERMTDWQGYVDTLCYASLTRHYQKNKIGAKYYFNIAASMWDGKGLADKGFWWTNSSSCGKYETYKLALLLLTSKVIGEELDYERELCARIWECQHKNGGIITHYLPDGTPDPKADANSETTALVLLAEPRAMP